MNNIKEFIERQDYKESLSLEIKPLSEYTNYLETLGFELENQDTNGWKVDFCITFEKDLLLSGSLYYGDYKLNWTKEDE